MKQFIKNQEFKIIGFRAEREIEYTATFLRMGSDDHTYLIMLNGKPTKLSDGKFGLKATRMNGTRFTTLFEHGHFA